MKKIRLTKAALSLLITTTMLVFNSIGAMAESKQDSGDIGWKLIDGKYYYYSGEKVWEHDITVDGYYLGTDGARDVLKNKAASQDITMKTEKNIYEIGTKDINIYITNNTNLDSGYGTAYEIDKFENNEWHQLDFVGDTNSGAISCMLKNKATNSVVCSIASIKDFKNLVPGKYRIVKEIFNTDGITNISAEFELQ